MIPKAKKQEIVKDLIDKLSRQKAVIFSDYSGLGVSQLENLRKKLKKEGIDFRVFKKTLIDLTLQKLGLEAIRTKNLNGQIAAAFGYEDEIKPAKILYNFSKENEKLKILAGIIGGEFFEAENIKDLAKLPPREDLLAQLAGNLSSPLSGLIKALEDNLRKFVYILTKMKHELWIMNYGLKQPLILNSWFLILK